LYTIRIDNPVRKENIVYELPAAAFFLAASAAASAAAFAFLSLSSFLD